MPRLAFKHADPSRKIPTYLQMNTVENVKWQLKLTAVLFVYLLGRDWWEHRQWQKKYGKTPYYK